MGRLLKVVRNDYRRRDAPLFKLDGRVATPRRAPASVAYAGNNQIALLGKDIYLHAYSFSMFGMI